MDLSNSLLSAQLGRAMEWEKWRQELPFINFPAQWEIQIIPPFHGAIIRFRVRLKNNPKNEISVYFDGYSVLGWYGTNEEGNPNPYWEIYPCIDGDIERFDADDIKGLLSGIAKALGDNDEKKIRKTKGKQKQNNRRKADRKPSSDS